MRTLNISKPIKIFSITLCILILFTLMGCSSNNGKEKESAAQSDNTSLSSESRTYTMEDATAAFEAFNKHFYSEQAHLYYKSTKGEKLASIWTQAIMWQTVMDAYQRTKNPDYLQLIHDIYKGGFKEYDGYNWENKKE